MTDVNNKSLTYFLTIFPIGWYIRPTYIFNNFQNIEKYCEDA